MPSTRRDVEEDPIDAMIDAELRSTAPIAAPRARGKAKGKGRGAKGKARGHATQGAMRSPTIDAHADAVSRTPMRRRPKDAPQPLPSVPIGENANASAMRRLCPHQNYASCWAPALKLKYPVTVIYRKGSFNRPVERAAAAFADCTPPPPLPGAEEVAATPGPSFVDAALEADARLEAAGAPSGAEPAAARRLDDSAAAEQVAGLRGRLRAARPAARSEAGAGAAPLACDSAAAALEARTMVLLGVPSFHGATATGRRAGSRASWMRSAEVGRRVAVCFLLSALSAPDALAPLEAEAARHGDMLFLQERETPQILKRPTRYSNYAKLGRGMPTFKQFAFFRHAARWLPRVPFVGKLDDDSALNPAPLLGMLARMRCAAAPRLFIGSINWASVVPRAHDTGVRLDRCGFGWNMGPSLENYGTSFGVRGTKGFFPSCDGIGGVPPFPYGIGAGYIFSAALLRWLANDGGVLRWVRDARDGPEREALQWQKFEDTSTGYWLTFSPERVRYVDVGAWIHDMRCDARGEEKRYRVGLYRPPAASSVITHNLKHGGFRTAWALMQPNATYDHAQCAADWPNARDFGPRRRARGGA